MFKSLVPNKRNSRAQNACVLEALADKAEAIFHAGDFSQWSNKEIQYIGEAATVALALRGITFEVSLTDRTGFGVFWSDLSYQNRYHVGQAIVGELRWRAETLREPRVPTIWSNHRIYEALISNTTTQNI